MEGLGQEALDSSGTGNRGAVLRAQFVHAEHRDDILQLAVFLQHLLHRAGGFIMVFAQHIRLQNAGGTLQRVHRGINAKLRNGSGQNRGRVQMCKSRGGGRICQVVRGYIDGLYRGDRTVARRGDTLLEITHLGSQRRLIADSGGHTSQQCRDLGASLGKAENIVDKQQHILSGLITEIFRDRQT